jgi:predicted enzyme related to lactoylglutathione lyase
MGRRVVLLEVDGRDVHALLGGSIVVPTSAVPGGRTIGMFATPEGHRIGVVKT